MGPSPVCMHGNGFSTKAKMQFTLRCQFYLFTYFNYVSFLLFSLKTEMPPFFSLLVMKKGACFVIWIVIAGCESFCWEGKQDFLLGWRRQVQQIHTAARSFRETGPAAVRADERGVYHGGSLKANCDKIGWENEAVTQSAGGGVGVLFCTFVFRYIVSHMVRQRHSRFYAPRIDKMKQGDV